ncbi:MAG TPA: hypothetical protein IAC82_07200 [Candidatus Merdivicinus intestinigallinarum]|nr:hypothetical protein [Candidatus Merdivicinus intestinigallinarum]
MRKQSIPAFWGIAGERTVSGLGKIAGAGSPGPHITRNVSEKTAGRETRPLQMRFPFGFIKTGRRCGIVPYNWRIAVDNPPFSVQIPQNVPEKS